jgi:putative addiction module component (TIGR02574 family)
MDGWDPLGYTSLVAIEALIEQALRLSAEERAKLIELLLDSLDDADDPGHEAAWAEVVDRRLQDIRAGRVELVDAADAMAQARAAARR